MKVNAKDVHNLWWWGKPRRPTNQLTWHQYEFYKSAMQLIIYIIFTWNYYITFRTTYAFKAKILPQLILSPHLFAFCFWRLRFHMKFHSWNSSHPFLFKNNTTEKIGFIHRNHISIHNKFEKHCASMQYANAASQFPYLFNVKMRLLLFVNKIQKIKHSQSAIQNSNQFIIFSEWNVKKIVFYGARIFLLLKCVVIKFRSTFRIIDKIWSNNLI